MSAAPTRRCEYVKPAGGGRWRINKPLLFTLLLIYQIKLQLTGDRFTSAGRWAGLGGTDRRCVALSRSTWRALSSVGVGICLHPVVMGTILKGERVMSELKMAPSSCFFSLE